MSAVACELTNSADPDQTALEQSDQGLHCLLMRVSLNIQGQYGMLCLGIAAVSKQQQKLRLTTLADVTLKVKSPMLEK